MKFNERLLEKLPADDRALAKIVLFCLQEDLNLVSFVEKPGIVNNIHEISGNLWQNGQVREDILSNQLLPAEPLYLEEKANVPEDFDISRLRQYWSYKHIGVRGKQSNKRRVAELLSNWFLENPGYNMADVERAGREYIEHCMLNNRFMRDVDKFIDNGEDSALLTWVEQAADNPYTYDPDDGVL